MLGICAFVLRPDLEKAIGEFWVWQLRDQEGPSWKGRMHNANETSTALKNG